MSRDIITRLVSNLYNRLLRGALPSKISVHNGIAARNIKLLDKTEHFPTEKAEFIDPLVRESRPGDTVVQIGGGVGLSSVAAAEAVGPEGQAITYEASKHQINKIKETVQLNRKTWRDSSPVDIRHGLVGEAIKIEADLGDPNVVPPEALPECEVFALDCEGAELGILQSTSLSPRVIVVETHGWLGSATSDVRTVLEDSGYKIIDEIAERPDKDNYVLIAQSNGDT